MRSFGLVEFKIYETDYFLDKIKECTYMIDCNYLLSAFLSASRSITFSLQACMKDIEGFSEWYKEKQVILKGSRLSKKFLEMRNTSQKIGRTFVGSGRSFTDKDGNIRYQFYFKEESNYYDKGELPHEKILETLFSDSFHNKVEDDIASQCEENFMLILKIIKNCFNKFGNIIDPELYYTLDNINNMRLTLEDVEENLGFDRGYTNINGISDEKRMKLIRDNEPSTEIDYILQKYLSCGRYD